ncbi:MAG: protein translocase subunit SecF [Candidatus Harrisonbacteria bacterium CG10_big_fil_rev_8_21_14_0_10_38_8]|uniref:Protein-export membrane protein SecF n=1 Tax=Candidatus Harrisonbacteria bacterium CG10_big_fil_rev_8_21_14_0_10_38_8 TaxID=1974582 RepID=A0A2M6WKI0_9BACT|nr:MAG: protein translocase subunit SecF [Candidatus Harrisonbacteria bacterium CG10_big_fil_rev_8_21_14_0_10_38_8]
MINIISKRKIFLTFSGLLVAISLIGLIAFGLQRGIDFTGGTLWQIQFEETSVTQEALSDFVTSELSLSYSKISQDDSGAFFLKLGEITEADHQSYSQGIRSEFGNFNELRFESIGATIGKELSQKAIWAFIINLIAIALYVAYAFREVSYPVSSWKYAVITIVTLFHDAIIPIGVFTFLGYFMGVEIDTNFIVAILVVVGFSVHDTIVVFDRIRENIKVKNLNKLGFPELVNQSVNETFARSINTSLTLVVVLVALYVLGASSLGYFILAILIGTITGTYSSIFLASPLLVAWQGGRK